VETIPPLSMMGVRFLAAGAVLYGWARLRGAPRPAAAHWRGAAEIGAALFLVTHGLIGWAELRIPSGLAALLGSTVPFWMVLLSWAGEGGRRPGRRVVRGIAMGLAGVAVLVGPGLRGDGGVDLAAAAAVLVAALAWSWGSLRAKRVAQPASQAMATGLQLLSGGAMLVAAGAAAGEMSAARWDAIAPRSLLSLGYLTVFGSIVAYSAYAWLLRTVSPTRVATHAFVNPIVAVALGWLAGEPVGARTVVAALMIIAAVVWIVLPAGRPRPTPPRQSVALAPQTPCAAS
jgi:drug/metabolite transporter (DMT)-like permease